MRRAYVSKIEFFKINFIYTIFIFEELSEKLFKLEKIYTLFLKDDIVFIFTNQLTCKNLFFRYSIFLSNLL